MADLERRIERELIAAAGRSGRLRYARSPLPRPAALAAMVASAALLVAAIASVSLVDESPAPRPALDERPVATPSPRPQDERRRTMRTPQPAPAEIAAAYSSLADGQVHDGPPIPRATVTIHGNSTGGCIVVMPDGARGPGGSCFDVQNVRAQNQWMTTGGTLFVLVPDAATDISIESRDGTRRPGTATSNLVVAKPSDTVRFTVDGKRMTVAVKRPK